jgi:hypothetical protein
MLIGLALIGLLAWTAPRPAEAASSAFGDWAAIVVAGDWHAHSGKPSEVFDDARRDLTKAFIARGFAPDHIRQFSVRPERYPKERVLQTNPDPISETLNSLARDATGGCLVYFTSHGSPVGIIVNGRIWEPSAMADLVNDACGPRPSVVILSSCFSGVFIPALAAPNRLILTAARADRASFGCGESDRYTFFDACILQDLGKAHDFEALGQAAQACVAKREHELNAEPPSHPQMDIGAGFRPMAPLFAFAASP